MTVAPHSRSSGSPAADNRWSRSSMSKQTALSMAENASAMPALLSRENHFKTGAQ